MHVRHQGSCDSAGGGMGLGLCISFSNKTLFPTGTYNCTYLCADISMHVYLCDVQSGHDMSPLTLLCGESIKKPK